MDASLSTTRTPRSEAMRERLEQLRNHLWRCAAARPSDLGVSGAYACAAACCANILEDKDPFEERDD